MILGLTGYSSAGKDTVANYLIKEHGFVRLAFADKVKELAYRLDPELGYSHSLARMVDKGGWDNVKRLPEVRKYLQTLGTSCREIQGEDVWVDALEADGHNLSLLVAADFGEKDVVITDVRFANEAEWLEGYESGKIVRVTRPGVGPVNDHPSETAMSGWVPSWHIRNEKDLDWLYGEVDEMMSMLEGLDAE